MPNKLLVIAAILIVAFISCSPIEKKVSKEEATSLTKKLIKQATIKSKDFLVSSISIDALANRISNGQHIKQKASFLQGVKEGFANSNMAQKIYETCGEDGFIELVKQYSKDGKQRAIFRVFGKGLNYLDFEFTNIKNETKIADIFIYTAGENLSSTFANLISNKSTEVFDNIVVIQNIKKLMVKSKYSEAKQQFENLPTNVKSNKILQLMNLQICQQLSDSTYTKALNDFEVQFKNEPYMFLTLIDVYFLRKDYTKAIDAVNKIDEMIDKDPFLDYYRGLIYKTAGDTAKAELCFSLTIKNMPDFKRPYIELLTFYTTKNNKQKAREIYNK